MQLTTWTIYKAKNLKNIQRQVIVEKEFPFLLLRPDLNEPNTFLGMAIVNDFTSAMVSDLLNRDLNPNQLMEIFKDKLGTVNLTDLTTYDLQGTNISQGSILPKNIQLLMETYNLLIKSDPITFASEDYDTAEKVASNQDIFLEVDFQKMPMHQLINAINSGMPEFYRRLNELRANKFDESTHQRKILEMTGLQTNLIFFLENALKRMDEVIGEQQKEIQELKAENEKNKGEKNA